MFSRHGREVGTRAECSFSRRAVRRESVEVDSENYASFGHACRWRPLPPGRCAMRSRHNFFVLIFVVGLTLLLPSLLFADVTGSVLGVVRDPSQAAVKGARIRITNTQTNLSHEEVTGDDGSYRFLALPAGTYQLSAAIAGFQQYNAT